MSYSAVTQPSPLLSRHGGTPASKDAVHKTCVWPHLMSTEPGANFVKPRTISTLRSSSARRPSILANRTPFV